MNNNKKIDFFEIGIKQNKLIKKDEESGFFFQNQIKQKIKSLKN